MLVIVGSVAALVIVSAMAVMQLRTVQRKRFAERLEPPKGIDQCAAAYRRFDRALRDANGSVVRAKAAGVFTDYSDFDQDAMLRNRSERWE
jgi:hypothetical protein